MKTMVMGVTLFLFIRKVSFGYLITWYSFMLLLFIYWKPMVVSVRVAGPDV